MEKILGPLVALLFLFVAGALDANAVYVTGYTTEEGTYLKARIRILPNKSKNDNYSTKGNLNPSTGKAETKSRDGDTVDVAKNTAAFATSPAAELKGIGTLHLNFAMPGPELKQQLGPSGAIEDKGYFDIGTYPSGMVFVKEGELIVWKQEKSR